MTKLSGREGVIYGLADPRDNKIRYIGQSRRPERRLAGHIHDATAGKKSHKARWVRKLLADDVRPIMRILETAPEDLLDGLETEWIKALKEAGVSLANATLGGKHDYSQQVEKMMGHAPFYVHPKKTDMERLYDKILVGDECWIWTGALNRGGYGIFRLTDNKNSLAHRYIYEMLVQPIPDGMQVDHLCDNRDCVRPDHLLQSTPKEIGGRSADERETCRSGHPYTEDNTYYVKNGYRRCRTCRNATARRPQRRRRIAIRDASSLSVNPVDASRKDRTVS